MISYDELSNASSAFDADKVKIWKIWIRQIKRFSDDPLFFSDLDLRLGILLVVDADELVQAEREVTKRCLNVLQPKIEALDRQVSVSGGEDAVRYSMGAEREWLIGEGVEAIYNTDDYFESTAASSYNNLITVGQRCE